MVTVVHYNYVMYILAIEAVAKIYNFEAIEAVR